jgi:hypothetical protein
MTDPAVPAPDDESAGETPAPAAPPVQPHPSASAAPYGLAPAPVPPSPAAVAWGQPVYAAAPPKGMSLTSMILGLVSVFFFWTFLCPLIGLVFGIVGFRKEPAGRGFAITGLVLNGLLLLIPVAFVLSIVVAGGTLFGIAATTPR